MNLRALNFFSGKSFLIEQSFGLSQLYAYSEKLDLMDKGTPKASLFYYENTSAKAKTVKTDKGYKVQVLEFDGAMMLEDGWCNDGMRTFGNAIKEADNSNAFDGIILKITTGGGEVLAGQELYNSIKGAKKPIIVLSDFLASAGIMGTLAADAIYATGEYSQFGSIGVMTTINIQNLEKIKSTYKNLYSENSPNKNGEYESLLKGNEQPIIDHLTEIDNIFMGNVSKYRDLKGEQSIIDETLSGKIFMANDAVSRGLIDGVVSFSEALQNIETLISKNKSGNFKKKKPTKKDMNMKLSMESILDFFKGNAAINAVEAIEGNENKLLEEIGNQLTEQKNAIAALSKNAANYEAKVNELTELTNALQSKVDELSSSNEQLRSELSSSKELVKSLQNENTILKSRNTELDKEVISLKGNSISKIIDEAGSSKEIERIIIQNTTRNFTT